MTLALDGATEKVFGRFGLTVYRGKYCAFIAQLSILDDDLWSWDEKGNSVEDALSNLYESAKHLKLGPIPDFRTCVFNETEIGTQIMLPATTCLGLK